MSEQSGDIPSDILNSYNEGGKVRVFRAVAELMGEMFFASLEPGDNFVTEPLILNTALYYALGYSHADYVHFPVKRNKQNPTYLEDTASIADWLYITPAKAMDSIRFTSEFYNSRSDEYVQPNTLNKKDSSCNTPTGRYGTRKQIQPGARFCFYVLTFNGSAPDMPPYIRVGKKRCKAHVNWSELPAKRSNGKYLMNHPVLLEDLDVIPESNIDFKRMQPFDILKKGRFVGDYIAIDDPDFGQVVIPAGVRFLRRRRG